MLDHAVLQSVAKQLLNNTKIDLDGKISRVTRTSSQHLRTTTFEMDGRQFQANRAKRHQAQPMGTARPRGPSGHSVQRRSDQQVCSSFS